MNRDAVLATLIGFLLGLLITSVILFGPRAVAQLSKLDIQLPQLAFMMPKKTQPTPQITPPVMPKTNDPLTIFSPKSDLITDNNEIVVNGSVLAGSTLIIAGLNDETVVSVGKEGKYTGKITLTEGINTISVSAYKDGKSYEKTVVVYYTEDKLP